MNHAYIVDAIRTPFGRYGGALSSVRTDDLGAIPIRALMARNPKVDWAAVADVIYGCANQAGEDNRNVARMSALLAGLVRAAVDHVDDGGPVDLGVACHQCTDRDRAEVIGAHRTQGTAVAAERRADGVDDVGVVHGSRSPRFRRLAGQRPTGAAVRPGSGPRPCRSP